MTKFKTLKKRNRKSVHPYFHGTLFETYKDWIAENMFRYNSVICKWAPYENLLWLSEEMDRRFPKEDNSIEPGKSFTETFNDAVNAGVPYDMALIKKLCTGANFGASGLIDAKFSPVFGLAGDSCCFLGDDGLPALRRLITGAGLPETELNYEIAPLEKLTDLNGEIEELKKLVEAGEKKFWKAMKGNTSSLEQIWHAVFYFNGNPTSKDLLNWALDYADRTEEYQIILMNKYWYSSMMYILNAKPIIDEDLKRVYEEEVWMPACKMLMENYRHISVERNTGKAFYEEDYQRWELYYPKIYTIEAYENLNRDYPIKGFK